MLIATLTSALPIVVAAGPPAVGVLVLSPSSASLRVSESAAITTTGIISAVAPGSSIITVTVTGAGVGFTTHTTTATLNVSVTALPAALTSVSVTPTTAEQSVSQEITLTRFAVIGGPGVSTSYAFASSVLGVATVSSNGVVRAIAPGNALITVTAIGTGSGFTTTALTTISAITVSKRCARSR